MAMEETLGYAGGGAMPMQALAGRAIALQSCRFSAEDLARRLRTGARPVLGRIEKDRVLIELRTIADSEVPALAEAIRAAA
jgi:L-seryl-tRNA(Ser) seleniumtransferase